MASTSHDHEDPDPVTDRMHDTSWSANLETERHAGSADLVKSQAIDAIEHTRPGNHVNLVTHADHGHPSSYLYDHVRGRFGDEVTLEYVQQCGCGGHVTRVHVDRNDA